MGNLVRKRNLYSDSMSGGDKEEHWMKKILSTGIGIGHGTGRVYPRK